MFPKTQALIQEQLAAGVYPGVCYGLIKNGRIESQVFGWAQLVPEKEPMSYETRFDVASLTKVVCTTTVMLQLLEKERLWLDDSLQKYLPAFTDGRITLRHLLTHTSDIQTWIPSRDQLSASELRQAYYTLEAGENLGEVVKYTDAGTILLGFMLEELYQKPLTDIFQREVLAPLGMSQSCFLPTATSGVAATEELEDGQVLKGITHDPKARVLGSHAGNAGLFTTLEDLLTFCQMYLKEGIHQNHVFLKRETLQQLLRDATPTGTGGRSIGWDLLNTPNQQPVLFHTGYTGTFLIIDILKQDAFVFLSNRVHPKDHRASYLNHRDQLVRIYLKECFD